MNILMVAAENDGIENCKVGGIADFIRDIPVLLSHNGFSVSVVTPSYGYLHEAGGSEKIAEIHFPFAGAEQIADLYRVRPKSAGGELASHYVIDHPAFKVEEGTHGKYEIYSHDAPDRPFSTDATKFACFNASIATAIEKQYFGPLDILHLHDWHATFLLILRRFDPCCEHLKSLSIVYTIHNLALQGVRPFNQDYSSLESWYPQLELNAELIRTLADPRWNDCLNPMAAGIRLADAIHTVRPTYVYGIPGSSSSTEYFGGKGLEADLKAAEEAGRLNGCKHLLERDGQCALPALLDLLKKQADS
jgi:starch synthase